MAIAGPLLGLACVVAVFSLCSHLLTKSQRSGADRQSSSEAFEQDAPSDSSD
jgi:hypothetical protein